MCAWRSLLLWLRLWRRCAAAAAIPLFAFSVPEAELFSGPFRASGGGKTEGAVLSGSGSLDQFRGLFEQLYQYADNYVRTTLGKSLLKPAPAAVSDGGVAPGAEAAAGWVGRRVKLVGLLSRSELNGQIGTVERFDEKKDRYVVRLTATSGAGGATKPIAVKEANLQHDAPAEDAEQRERGGKADL